MGKALTAAGVAVFLLAVLLGVSKCAADSYKVTPDAPPPPSLSSTTRLSR